MMTKGPADDIIQLWDESGWRVAGGTHYVDETDF
jgi:hypothetical protein